MMCASGRSVGRFGGLRSCGIAGLLAFLFAAPANAVGSPPVLPPISDPASMEHHAGKVVLVELVTPDLAAAKRFYGGLFGWTFHDIHAPGLDYSVPLLDGRPVGGMLQRAAPATGPRQASWLTFLSTPDVDAGTRQALARGGKVLFSARTYPGRGRQVVLADPEGAVFALVASESGDAPDFLAMPGEWIWSSLLVADADRDAAFYQELLGYDVYDQPGEDGREHAILSSDDYARASVNSLPAKAPSARPHWLNFVRVASAGDCVQRATALGATVLVGPQADRHGGQVAVIADPSGAAFGVMEWAPEDSKEQPR